MQALRDGHHLQLLRGADEYFPALIADIDAARLEVNFETYIFDLHAGGAGVAESLIRAARRGVRAQLVVDGAGTGALPAEWQTRFDQAGVQWRIFNRLGRFGLLDRGGWRRLHRKLCLIDGELAYCGGINVLDDRYDPNHGNLERPRFDFGVRVRGPLVQDVHEARSHLWWRLQAVRDVRRHDFAAAWEALARAREQGRTDAAARTPAPPGRGARAGLLLRDNLSHRKRIERAYLQAIGEARHEIIIANAYFIPGARLRRALALAARRGVKVRLLLQGRYEYFMQYHAAKPVYGMLLEAGVEIHEYAASFLHAKVAVVDGRWATVGSSNLDPLSLLLAREANVVVEDAVFAADLGERLTLAIVQDGRPVNPAEYADRPLRQRMLGWIAYGIMRTILAVTGNRY